VAISKNKDSTVVGIAEIAEMLGVSKQRASELGGQDNFPRPMATLRSGRVWRRADIERFAKDWKRKPGNPHGWKQVNAKS
jgi:predicted DNA-binding transcriptional regulator AlpA